MSYGAYTRGTEVYVLPSANPIAEIGSEYFANVYHGNGILLPILRQKILWYDVY
jgi:hypothetical protein